MFPLPPVGVIIPSETETSSEGSPVIPPRPPPWPPYEDIGVVPPMPDRPAHYLPPSDSDKGSIILPSPPPGFPPVVPSTVRGWLTKMRGTLVDNEAMRSRGTEEMKQAAVARLRRRKEETDRELRNLARTGTDKSPLKQSIKQPWLRLPFSRSRSKPVAGGSGRPVATTSESPAHARKRRPSSSIPYISPNVGTASTSPPSTGG